MNNHDKALHDLICDSLRGQHTRGFSLNEMHKYNYSLGLALHNIPNYLSTNNALPLTAYVEINKLDPTGDIGKWGEWCKRFSCTIEQLLPNYPKDLAEV